MGHLWEEGVQILGSLKIGIGLGFNVLCQLNHESVCGGMKKLEVRRVEMKEDTGEETNESLSRAVSSMLPVEL